MEIIITGSTIMLGRLLAPVIKDGWKKLTNADAKEEIKRIKRQNEEISTKLKLQRNSHEDRLKEAEKAHELSMQMWKQKTYYEKCWPLRNPFEMQICQPISNDKSYFGDNIIVPCRIISALKNSDHPFARTINGNLSSFVVNNYPTNSIHAVVSEIGAWKDDAPTNDASINYLYAGLKKQPVMIIAPALINDGKIFIFKVWSWGLGEDLNYPAGFEFGRLELNPLYIKTIYDETIKMMKLAQELGHDTKIFSKEFQHNISIIKEIKSKNISGTNKNLMLNFLGPAPEINDRVKEEMESVVSGIFCCMAGMYADAYHLLEYKTLPKLPELFNKIHGIEYMIPSLKDYYYTLLTTLERIEDDKNLISQMYLDVADAFSKLKFSFTNNESVIEPFVEKSLSMFLKEQQPNEEEPSSLAEIRYVIKSEPEFQDEDILKKANMVLERSKIKTLW